MNNELCPYCPACGAKSFASHEEKRFDCASCGFTLFFGPVAAAGAVIPKGPDSNEILVAVRAHDPGKGKYDLPGGFADYNENSEEALTRELREELDLDVSTEQLEYLCSHPNVYTYEQVTYQVLDAFFIAHINDFTGMQALDDVESLQFMNIKNIDPDNFAFKSTRAAFLKYRKQLLGN